VPDLTAAFRTAALHLDGGQPHDAAWRVAAREAGDALVALAQADLLAHEQLLQPGPRGPFTWTALCYREGDVHPVHIQDFDHPDPAVLAFVECDDFDHVSGEVIVSDPDGARWTALARHPGEIVFQPPDALTVTSDTDDAGLLASVIAHWSLQIRRWERRATAAAAERRPSLGERVEGRLEEIQEQQDAIIDALTALDERIAGLEKHLHDQGGLKSLRDRWSPR
jgi:hypothetical protein